MRILSVVNQKGGCGKTTVSINLAAALAKRKKDVLLVDMDPQGHASLGLNLDPEDYERSTYDVLMHAEFEFDQVVIPVVEHLDVCPGSVVLAAVEQELKDRPGRERRLLAKLQSMRHPYEYVILDCPPAIGLLTFNALTASQEAIIPVDPSFFSLHGLHKVRETIELLREEIGHEVQIRVLANNCNSRTNFSRDILYEIQNFHGDSMLRTVISHTVKLKEAASRGQPVTKFDPAGRATKEFAALAEELLAQEPFLRVGEVGTRAPAFQGPQPLPGGVRFVLDAPHAREVRVTGSFTDWSFDGFPLQRSEDGLWSGTIAVGGGQHEYRFIIDGVWVKDPNNEASVMNEFGQENSVVNVPADLVAHG
ncbi:MAG TPA: AAA family ATPase [Candidatus Krumholzibacteria bacterium]|jgi:chromosome partitioning protein|nr:AAA family ATPase [Candidatus Krumholzibacteria bacterium]